MSSRTIKRTESIAGVLLSLVVLLLLIVGGAQPPDQGPQLSLQSAPDPQFGWNNQAYAVAWSMQLGAFLRTHVVNGQTVAAPAPDVNENENVPLLVAEGWRD